MRHPTRARTPLNELRPPDQGLVNTAAPGPGQPPNLSRRASLNAVASGLDYGARTAVEFALNPFLLSSLGSYLYGAWRVLWRLTGYLWATSGRSAQALQAAIANRQRSTDDDERRRLVGASIVVWVLFLPVLLVVGGIGVWVVPTALDTPSQHVWSVRMAAALLCADAIALTLLSVPKSVLQGENLGYRRMGLSTALVLLGGVTTVVAVQLEIGIVGVALAHLANTLYTGFLFWRVTARYVPWFAVSRPSRREVRWFLGLSSWFTGWKLVNQLLVAGDVVVLGVVGSVELVTVYTLMKYVPEAILPLIALLVQGGVPALGGMIGAGEHERARRIRAEVMAATWLVATVLSLAIVAWNESFVGLWVGPDHYAGDLQTVLIVGMLLQLSMIRNDAFIIDLTLDVRDKVLLGLLSAVASLGLAGFLIGAFEAGITGLCVGIIAGRSLLTFTYPHLIGRAIGHPLAAQVRSAIRPGLTSVALLGGALVLGGGLRTDSWLVLIGGGGLTAVVLAPLAAVLGLDHRQRHALVARAGRITGRR